MNNSTLFILGKIASGNPLSQIYFIIQPSCMPCHIRFHSWSRMYEKCWYPWHIFHSEFKVIDLKFRENMSCVWTGPKMLRRIYNSNVKHIRHCEYRDEIRCYNLPFVLNSKGEIRWEWSDTYSNPNHNHQGKNVSAWLQDTGNHNV